MKTDTRGRRIGACILGAALGFVPLMVSATSLPGSHFEIDANANFAVDGTVPPAIDWALPAVASAAVVVIDQLTGSNDDSFKGGTKEDSVNPQTTTGSIPNNKSDLKHFGVYQESNGGDFLNLFWTRVQNPSGTTLMDFEFNAGNNLYPATSTGAQFPVREAGDLLVEYKLAQGGTTPQLFLYEWLVSGGNCEASNSYPCWGNKTDLAGIAIGSINTSTVSSGALGIDSFDPYTFGEASIDLNAIFPAGACRSFGFASLKSRSSDSFSAQMKDFIAPYPVNISNCANINIKKTDDGDPPMNLAGAVFRLYNDDGGTVGVFDTASAATPDTRATVRDSNPAVVIPDCTTDSDGECSWINVFAADYCIVEVTPPTGHSLPTDPDYYDCGTVTADNDFDVMFTNPRQPATVNILKKDDADPPSLLLGAEFTLYNDVGTVGTYDDGVDTSTGKSCTTNAAGVCSISNILPQGNYCIVETVTPTGYDTAAPQCENISLNETVELTFIDPRQPATVNILKKDDADPPSLLLGAEFTLYNDVGTVGTYDDGVDTSTGKSCTTNAAGVCSISNILPQGNYCIVETVTPTGYDTAAPQCENISLNETVELTFIDPRQPATVNILKKDDAEPPNLLSGAEFTLYNDTGLVGTYEDGVDSSTGKTCTTNASGVCSISNILPPGNYCLVETITPSGYTTADPQCVSLSLNDTVNLTFIDPRQAATVNVLKKDDAEPPNLLLGAEFTLYNDAGTVGVYDDGVDSSTGKTCTTNASGVCSISNILPPGDYCLVETLTPTGYDTADPQCVSIGLNETINLEFIDPRQPASVNILKKDDADNVLQGAGFTLYNDLGTVGTYDNGVDTSTGKTCVTSASGICTIDQILPPGGYCLVETVTPVGYETADPQCTNLSLNETVNLEFVDPRKRGAILITKTRKHAADGPGDHAHAGVTFTVSGGGLAVPAEVVTDANGQACVDDLLFSEFFGGNYSVTETLPTGYAADGDLTKFVTVDTVAGCDDSPYVGEEVSFSNTPLSDITVSFSSQVDGGTAATIDCQLANNPVDLSPAAFDDVSETSVDLLPGTYTCIIVVDP
ncbi:MSCRAMM family protein [Marinobacterium rhizophilum]|uniref:SpaA-like prealbumin fold domain-containing protein n=1 Tax=Marinobacterium rhizophilum TaxID=420402 RepID=A0ABY5HIJ9_9GAMM|nr:SpaA isopeptide-forming pilin-related protein [Marinobacterium rhizophilum]UTW12195.1 hypothetical protein KDW95_00430 [Marinobacterium rhizophilum]